MWRNPLSYHTRNTARLTDRARDVVLEVANRRRANITRPHIRPGPAAFLAFTGGSAALAAGIGRQFEVSIVAAVAIDPKFRRSAPRLDDPGPAYAGDAACRCEPRHDLGFQPANGIGILCYGIGESPCPAARIPLAAGGALGRITGPHGKARVVSPRPVEIDLSAGRRAEHDKRDQQTNTHPEPLAHHAGLSLAPLEPSEPC